MQDIDLSLIIPGKYQPRKHFNIECSLDLEASVEATGVVEPIVVRPMSDGRFEIISGERRWRAAKAASCKTAECAVREMSDEEAALASLSANLYEPLNAIDEAFAFAVLEQEFKLTHAAIAKAAGKRDNRAYVTKAIRLLKLPQLVQDHIAEGELSASHGQTLLLLHPDKETEILPMATAAIRGNWSVEHLRRAIESSSVPAPPAGSNDLSDLEASISKQIGLDFAIKHKANGSFTATLKGTSPDQLEDLLKRLKR